MKKIYCSVAFIFCFNNLIERKNAIESFYGTDYELTGDEMEADIIVVTNKQKILPDWKVEIGIYNIKNNIITKKQ